jgi:hypothetical protein
MQSGPGAYRWSAVETILGGGTFNRNIGEFSTGVDAELKPGEQFPQNWREAMAKTPGAFWHTENEDRFTWPKVARLRAPSLRFVRPRQQTGIELAAAMTTPYKGDLPMAGQLQL